MRIFRRLSVCTLALLILCGTVFAANPQIKVTIEKRGDAFIVYTTVDFAVPLRMAWDVLTDFDHMIGILSNLTSSAITARNGNSLIVKQEGKARYGPFSYSFASEREIRLEPKRRIFARQLSGNAKRFVSELELSKTDNGSQARYHAEVTPDSGLARTFGGPLIQHEVEEQFTAMAAEMLRRRAL